jgi:hypothetical protein
MFDFFFVRAIQNNQTKANIIKFLNNQNNWMRSQIKSRSDPIWRHVISSMNNFNQNIHKYRYSGRIRYYSV